MLSKAKRKKPDQSETVSNLFRMFFPCCLSTINFSLSVCSNLIDISDISLGPPHASRKSHTNRLIFHHTWPKSDCRHRTRFSLDFIRLNRPGSLHTGLSRVILCFFGHRRRAHTGRCCHRANIRCLCSAFLMDDRQFGYLFSLPFFYPPSILLVASSHRRRRKRKELTSESLYLSSNHVSLWQPNKTFLHKMRCLKTHSEREGTTSYIKQRSRETWG